MAATIILAGQKITLEIPDRYADVLYTCFSPFEVFESDLQRTVFTVVLSEETAVYGSAACRTDVFVHEITGYTFSIFNSHFDMTVSLDSRTGVLTLSSKVPDLLALMYSALKWFITFITLYDGALPLHSSLVDMSGEGILFSGPSGRGKSTISTLVATYTHGAVRGSDELNVLCGEPQELAAYSTPFYSSGGSGALKDLISIKKIYFLEQSSENRVESLSKSQKFQLLLKNVYHAAFNGFLAERMMEAVEKYSTFSAIDILYFKNDRSIVDFLTNQLGYDNEVFYQSSTINT